MMPPPSVRCIYRLARLPGDRTPVAEEAAGGTVVREGSCPDGPFGALLDRAWGTKAAHVGLDPAGLDGVDEDAAPAQLGGQDAGEGVEARLGDAVAGGAAAHVLERRHAGGDVDDPAVPVAPHERDCHLAETPRAEQVRLQRLAHTVQVGVHAALAVVVG